MSFSNFGEILFKVFFSDLSEQHLSNRGLECYHDGHDLLLMLDNALFTYPERGILLWLLLDHFEDIFGPFFYEQPRLVGDIWLAIELNAELLMNASASITFDLLVFLFLKVLIEFFGSHLSLFSQL